MSDSRAPADHPAARAGESTGERAARRAADRLSAAGGLVFALGFVAVLGVLLAGDQPVADLLITAATVLVPLGFCLAAAGVALSVRARVRESR